MVEEHARASGSRRARSKASSQEAPALPTDKAFVLQLSQETDPTLTPFVGRVEHLASGRRLRFDDFAGFHAALTRLLTETNHSQT